MQATAILATAILAPAIKIYPRPVARAKGRATQAEASFLHLTCRDIRVTMQTVLIVVHLIVVIGLVGVVLLQRSEGGGLGMGGGGSGGVSGFMTGRGQANALTRATAILAGLFFLTSITLSVIASQGRAQKSLIDGATSRPAAGSPATPSVPTPGQGGVLDQLRQLQDAAPQRPTTPAPAN